MIDIESSGQGNLVVGWRAQSDYNDCFVIGDDCSSEHDGHIVIGKTLFGKPLSDMERLAIESNLHFLKALVHLMASIHQEVYLD